LNASDNSYFDKLNRFILKRHRWIIVVWILALVASATLVPSFFSAVSYNITSVGGGPTNSESQKTQNILNQQFPSSANSGNNSIIVLVQNASVYSDSLRNAVLSMNKTLTNDRNNFTGVETIYNLEFSLLNSSLPSLVKQLETMQSNVTSINKELHALEQNLSSLNSNIFQLELGINQTAQIVYGLPSAFVETWKAVLSHNVTNPYIANYEANSSLYSQTNDFGGSAQSIGYYTTFYQAWNASFQSSPQLNVPSPSIREAAAVNATVQDFLSNDQINSQEKQTFSLVVSGLNATDFNLQSAVTNLTLSTISKNIPSSLWTSLGISAPDLIAKLYGFGPSPSNQVLSNYTIFLTEKSFSKSANISGSGISIGDLLRESYNLGVSYSSNDSLALAAGVIANATVNAFAASPLFVANSTSLRTLFMNLGPNASYAAIHLSVNNIISNESYASYPFLPTRALTQNFISKDNRSMILLLNFSSAPDTNTIQKVESDVKNSDLSNFGIVYVTGSVVITQDVSNVFAPATEVTLGPGIIIALLIVSLLFLSPVAGLIPIAMGGISILIAYSAIYIGVVMVGHQTVGFLTPTLATLLMLGLSVDYAALQLRRTREERQNGKTKEESVALSVKWAGQAVLTAGITVVVAYVVMAVANVPLFSNVGTSIALGVSILLAASLTLLPSLELALGDKMFWPSTRGRRKGFSGKLDLERLARNTLKRKYAITAVVSLLALGGLLLTYSTPIGANFLKLVPNFPSNAGLTALYGSFGSGAVAPTVIVISTPTPITYGDNQFNQTWLNAIESISNAAGNSSGVVEVTGPSRPYGSVFNYSQISSMPHAIRAQYQSGMLSEIGANNRTALISVGLSSQSESAQAVSDLLVLEQKVNALPQSNGISISYGGDTQGTYDSQSFILGLIPEVIAILAAAIYVILFAQLRSAFTPFRLIFTILCSVVFSLALLSVAFYHYLNLPILDFAPLFVVVTMLGVGIDYDIFFVTRIREEVLNGKNDDDAIKTAVSKVWVTILGIGLVLATVFSSLLITGIAILEEIGLAVAAAIVIDVVVIILFFVPSLMGIAERVNWWPSRIAKSRKSGS
jgi:putative drug exporter of the RND superfamily